MKRKGQALVEFVIILPIFLLMMLGVFDIGRIIYTKIELEDKMSDVITLYKEGNSKEKIIEKLKLEDNKLEIKEDSDYQNIEIRQEIEIITPGLNWIFDSPYEVLVKRSILNES